MTHQQEWQPSWVENLSPSRPFERCNSAILRLLFSGLMILSSNILSQLQIPADC